MPNPKLVVYPEAYSLLEIGVRQQQLLLLHPHAVRWQEPYLLADKYESLIAKLWRGCPGLTFIRAGVTPSSSLKKLAAEIDVQCADLMAMWQSAVEQSFNGYWVSSKSSALPAEIQKIKSLVDGILPRTDVLCAWFQVGRYAALSGSPGEEKEAHEEALQLQLERLSMKHSDLFAKRPSTIQGDRYLPGYKDWMRLDAGLERLAAIARGADLILAEPFLPTAQQTAILKALDGKSMNVDKLGHAIGGRRDVHSRKRGRDHLYELRVRGFVAWHPRHGFYRPDRPPAG